MTVDSNVKQAQRTNLKVWARRLKLDMDLDRAQRALEVLRMGGSVLSGPIAMCAARSWKDAIPERADRLETVMVFGRAMAALLRGSQCISDLEKYLSPIVASLSPARSIIVMRHGTKMMDLAVRMLSARDLEKSRPNLGNHIYAKIRKDRQVIREGNRDIMGNFM